MTKHCVFEYLYRDAGNFKAYGTLLLEGELGSDDIARYRANSIAANTSSQSKSGCRRFMKACGKNANLNLQRNSIMFGTSLGPFGRQPRRICKA